MEFPGPVTFSTTLGWSGVLSYLLTDDTDAVALPAVGPVGVPAGGSQLVVEHSTNLTNWSPVVLQPIGGAEKEFYRFRISR
jgi:hypothetical protein